ncbi:lactococcin 972 family bacteriocin [Streptomyces sp. NPDC056660]|uniref:lactococcin 972 family bacteriocin n=1 Tax=Streptomyces sp. NPDC056660 TaxID=3345897 RepID=UPI0036A9C15D
MKALSKRLTVVAAAAAIAAGVLTPAAPASAATSQPQGGMVVIKVDPSSSSVTPATTKDVGGGTWTYGTELTTEGKLCYSYYFHGSKNHTATAQIANAKQKVANSAGYSAKARAVAGSAYTCYAYWGIID